MPVCTIIDPADAENVSRSDAQSGVGVTVCDAVLPKISRSLARRPFVHHERIEIDRARVGRTRRTTEMAHAITLCDYSGNTSTS